MSELDRVEGRISRAVHGCKHIFWGISEEDISVSMGSEDDQSSPNDSIESRDVVTRGGGSSDSSTDGTGPTMEAGKRSPHWYERMGQVTEDNRTRSIENQKLLHRLDYRTVWIARLIIGLLISLIGGGIIELFIA